MPYRSNHLNLKKIFNTLRCRLFGTITHVATSKNIVALTFDDGPHPDTTPLLLDILKKHEAYSTFFLLGTSASRYPSLVKQIAQDGHAVCNHSWDHPSFPLISSQERRAQIRKCQKALAPYGKKYFRPPYGDQNFASLLDTLFTGHKAVAWNASGKDWVSNNPDWYVEHLKSQLKPGSIVLLHDTLYQTAGDLDGRNREYVFKALDVLLQQVGETYRFVTVPELIKQGRPRKHLWSKKSDMDWLNSLKQKDGSPRNYH